MMNISKQMVLKLSDLIKLAKKVHLKYRELSKDHVNFMVIIILVKAETNRITGISSKPPILLTPLFPTYFFQLTQTVKKKYMD